MWPWAWVVTGSASWDQGQRGGTRGSAKKASIPARVSAAPVGTLNLSLTRFRHRNVDAVPHRMVRAQRSKPSASWPTHLEPHSPRWLPGHSPPSKTRPRTCDHGCRTGLPSPLPWGRGEGHASSQLGHVTERHREPAWLPFFLKPRFLPQS